MDWFSDKLVDILQIREVAVNCSEKHFADILGDSPPSLLISTRRVGNHWNLHISLIYGPRSNQIHSAFYVGSEQ